MGWFTPCPIASSKDWSCGIHRPAVLERRHRQSEGCRRCRKTVEFAQSKEITSSTARLSMHKTCYLSRKFALKHCRTMQDTEPPGCLKPVTVCPRFRCRFRRPREARVCHHRKPNGGPAMAAGSCASGLRRFATGPRSCAVAAVAAVLCRGRGGSGASRGCWEAVRSNPQKFKI
eukprot:s359_g2.t1